MKLNKTRLIYTILWLFSVQPSLAASSFDTLKYFINARTQEPKVFVPDTTMLGKSVDIWIHAPGAKQIKVFGSTQSGEIEIGKTKLALGEDYKELGTYEITNSQNNKVMHELKLNQDTTPGITEYFVDALITYEDPQTKETITRRASPYSSNGVFTNRNLIRILAEPKDNTQMLNMARSFIPGLMGLPSTPSN